MRLISVIVSLAVPSAACVDASRKSSTDIDLLDIASDGAETPPDGGSEVAGPEVLPPGDIGEDGVEDVAADVPVTDHPCLPKGCVGPGDNCALEDDWCWIDGTCVEDGDRNPLEDCNYCDVAKSANAWTVSAGGSECDDGLSCTRNDACSGGVCRGTIDCQPASQSCLSPVCDAATDACVETLNPGSCYLGELCLSAGSMSNDGCGVCDPALSQDAWTPRDRHEPDGTLATAHPFLLDPSLLLTSDFENGWHGPWLGSRIVPVDDVDLFTFAHESDGKRRPWGRVTTDGAQPMRVCIHLRCGTPATGGTAVTSRGCAPGASEAVGPDADGWVGCCREEAIEDLDVGFETALCLVDGRLAVAPMETRIDVQRVLPAAAPACVPYELRWGMRN